MVQLLNNKTETSRQLKSKDKAAVKYIEKHVDRWVKKAGQIQVQAHGNCFLWHEGGKLWRLVSQWCNSKPTLL